VKLVPYGVMVAVGYVAGAKKNSIGGGRAITLVSGCFGVEVLQAGVGRGLESSNTSRNSSSGPTTGWCTDLVR
jgi:hypothetical protein